MADMPSNIEKLLKIKTFIESSWNGKEWKTAIIENEVQTKNFGESEDTMLELKRVKDEKLPESNIRQKVQIFLAPQQLISQTAKRAI